MSDRYKILVLAGGGAFGVLHTYLLNSLEIDYIYDCVDAGGGASVGSEVISGLACGKTVGDMHKSFLEAVFEIFKPRFWPNIRGAKHDTVVLQKHLRDIIDLDYNRFKMPVIIPVIDFRSNKLKVYDNILSKDDNIKGYIPATQSSSAPTYFDPFDGCIDGGLIENIPIITTTSAIKDKLGIKYQDMNVLAIGTGKYPLIQRDMKKVKRWFKWQWLPPLLEMLTGANEMASVFWGKQMGYNSFEYFNPVMLDEDWKMDKPHEWMDNLLDRTEKYVGDFKKSWDKFLNA